MFKLWKIRRYLAKKLNLPFLTDPHNSLHFADTTKIRLTPYVIQGKPNFDPSKDKLIFLHIPKAAGSSVNIILEVAAQYLKKNFVHCNVKNHTPSIKIVSNWQGATKTLYDIDNSKIQLIDFLSGHFIYGVDQVFNANCKYFTLIREPVEREVSSLNYIYQNGQIQKNADIEDYLFNVIDNPQTKILAGSQYMKSGCTEAMLHQAQENLLKRFLLFAPSEKTNELLQFLMGIYDLPNITYFQSNITRKKLLKTVSPEIQKRLSDYHSYDLALYQWVKERWHHWALTNLVKKAQTKENIVVDRLFQDTKKFQVIESNPTSLL